MEDTKIVSLRCISVYYKWNMIITVLCLGPRGDNCPACRPVLPGPSGDKGESGHPGKNCFLCKRFKLHDCHRMLH